MLGSYRRPGLLVAAAAALIGSMGALAGRSSADPRTLTSSGGYLDVPPTSRGGKSKPGRAYYRGPSRYMPHQGVAECLRRRMGGNARRIRMERAGFVWDDGARRYVSINPTGA